ncbi:TetR family transcriptional regulator [Paenibacillus sp. FSL H7-0326]|uniref:TetR/AcrR family transcriptional regulator n=1 Tax=Paenibacillus sp. FSL H7-0326 TaxID=1921144 RepID=UPI00096FB4C6|nr:TetR/AcrR family transcriptional regulator [Paenibacillus sp. FSL H7-0326]OMC67189.1 TetR family transcriptional regulator [Paenibacillus sp. FSL H7-0326]
MNENWQQTVKNKNREELIAASKQLFMENSFLSVKIHDICKSAGVSRVTFYKHFPSMDDLIFEIQMEILQAMTEFIMREATPEMNGLMQLESILNLWIEYARVHPEYIKFILLFDLHYESYNSNQELKQRYAEFIHKNKEQHFLSDALISGIRDGSLKADIDPISTAPFIFTSMMGLLQKLSITPIKAADSYQNQQMPEQFVSMILQYLRS